MTRNALTLFVSAGCLASTVHASTPALSTRATLNALPSAHIYYNLSTGEQIVMDLNTQNTRDVTDPGETVWVADNNTPCAAFGQLFGTAVILDNPNDFFGTGSAPETETLMRDWGDTPADTVVDCIQIAYGTSIEDADTNADGAGDGVEGFGATWSFYDGSDGFGDVCNYINGLISFTLTDLPGQLNGPGGFSTYLMTVDLESDFDSSLSFEIGDTDEDPQGASIHVPNYFSVDHDSDGIPDNDVDENGLADFGYAIRYIQPGTVDMDNADGDDDPTTGIDGDPLQQSITAVPLVHRRGNTILLDNGEDPVSYDVIPSAGPNAYSAVDAWDEFDYLGYYNATYWMGGFTCDDPDDGTVNPFGQIHLVMYGPFQSACFADWNNDETLDIFDVFSYLDAFNAADLTADFNADATLDVFDIFTYLDYSNAGCP
jgi:hypothetical protein